MHFVNLARRNLRPHHSSRSSMLSLLRTTDRASGQLHGPGEQQAGEEVLVRSDHPARGRATKRLTSGPQLTSHDRTLDDASSSSGRQTEKKMLEIRDRSSAGLQNRTLEQSGIEQSGIAWQSIFEYSRPAASRNDFEFSICRRSSKLRQATVYSLQLHEKKLFKPSAGICFFCVFFF